MKQILAAILLVSLLFSCKDEPLDPPKEPVNYGTAGSHHFTTYTTDDYAFTTAYYPEDIATMPEKLPVVFFISGWHSTPAASTVYQSLMEFIAGHGYIAIYTDEGATMNPDFSLGKIDDFLASEDETIKNILLPHMDISKIGIIGSSAGGGLVFTAMKHFSDKGYGENGRFMMAIEPWFALGMDETDMQSLPANINAVILQFGHRGNNAANGTDARIPLTEYSLLTSIHASKKDYQVYDKENADHTYPKGSRPFSEMQGILEPLHALMEYTFNNHSEDVRKAALEIGNDDPYDNGNGIQEVLDEYEYPCDGAETLIDYCSIVPL